MTADPLGRAASVSSGQPKRLRVAGESQNGAYPRVQRTIVYRNLRAEADQYADDDEPTPLYHASRPIEIEVKPQAAARTFRTVHVIATFAAYFGWVAFAKLRRRFDSEASALRLREIFERLGGIWIKLAQILSLRTDVLSADLCRELSRLQDRAKGFDPAVARAILEREIHVPIEFVFRSFEPLPFAAASISQVHRGVLRDRDQHVIVKIMRPDARNAFARDLRFFRLVAALFNRLRPHLGLNEAVYELEEIVREETDYGYEAANLRRMRKNLKRHNIVVPRTFPTLCTRNVLVMQEIRGALMTDFIRAQQTEPQRLARWLQENKIKPKRVAYRLVLSILRQVIEDNLFHADMHPGNIVLLRNGKVGLIDFGTVGSLEPEFRSLYMLFNRAVVSGEYRRAADYLIAMCPTIPVCNLRKLQEDLTRYYVRWEQSTHLADVPYFEKALTAASAESGRILQRYRLQPSWALMRISRTFGTLDASLAFLIPNGSLLKIYGAYFEERRRRAANVGYVMKEVGSKADGLLTLAQEAQAIFLPNVRLQALAARGQINRVNRIWDAVLTGVKRAFDLALLVALGILISHVWTYLVDLFWHPSVERAERDLTGFAATDWFFVSIVVVPLLSVLIVRGIRAQLRAHDTA